MIGGLQGDFGDLDIKYVKKNISKYLKKNISKCRLHISGSFRRTPRHCAKWLRNSRGKRYQQIRICLTEEVETPSFPIRICLLDVIHPEKVELRPDRMAVVIHPEKVELRPGIMAAVIHQEKVERRKGDRPRVHGVGTHPDQLHPDSPKGYATRSPIRTPSRRSTRHS